MFPINVRTGAPEIAIVGGAGHVGLPLALAFAEQGFCVRIVDRDEAALEVIRSGRMPFDDEGGQPRLEAALRAGRPQLRTQDIATIFIGAPHRAYRDLRFQPETLVIDVWNAFTSSTESAAGEGSS